MYTLSDKEKYNKISNVVIFGKKYKVIHQKKNVINSPIRIYMGLCYSTMETYFDKINTLWNKKNFQFILIGLLSTIVFTNIMRIVIANEHLRYRINACHDVKDENCEMLIIQNCEDELIEYLLNRNVTIRTFELSMAFEELKDCIKDNDPEWISNDMDDLFKLFVNISLSGLATLISSICILNFIKIAFDFTLLIICEYKKCIVYEFPEVKEVDSV